jgi:POT family proton-dependent oligopeptide transporter
MKKRSSFPSVFWVANTLEVVERYAYYGFYFGFGIYLTSLGFSKSDLGLLQFVLLLFTYGLTIFTGFLGDRFGFKKVLLVSYLLYFPPFILLVYVKSLLGITFILVLLSTAAALFKPLPAGTVRLSTDKTNKTIGFGIFYAMVNVGGTLGPLIMGALRVIKWEYAFMAGAAGIVLMALITLIFYREPERERPKESFGRHVKQAFSVLADLKFSFFLLLMGVMFWIPFWAFYNILALYVDSNLDTVKLYQDLHALFGGAVNLVSHEVEGKRRIAGESIAHTGYIILIMQIFVSRISERFKALPSIIFGLIVTAAGMAVLGLAFVVEPSFLFLGIFIFALGEMISSPRFDEYITYLAPKEKAGMYMGLVTASVAIGAFSGFIYTPLYGYFEAMGRPDAVWYVLAGHLAVGMLILSIYVKLTGGFKEVDE